jgi:hypothetical protein
MITAKIGDKNDYLYFIEERINKNFFSFRKLPWIIFNKNNFGSLIYNGTTKYSKQVLSNELVSMLDKRSSLSIELKSKIINDYSNLNNAIENNDVRKLKRFFDLDYMARFTAFNILFSADAHGFSSTNLEMAYDTTTHLFYPIAHRDVFSEFNGICLNDLEYTDRIKNNSHFWTVLYSDTTFQNKTKNNIKAFLIKNNNTSLTKELELIHLYYKSSHYFDFSYLNNIYDGYPIIKNIECMRDLNSN